MTGKETSWRSGVASLAGVPFVAATWRRLRPGLRIVAYHRVTDRQAFSAHLDHVAEKFVPVPGDEVLAALRDGRSLPSRAVWITFDDGDPTVVTNALPELARRGMVATMFVCPGLIEFGRPPWWHVVEQAGSLGLGANDGHLIGVELVRYLKRRPDDERRRIVEGLTLQVPDEMVADRVMSRKTLQTWVSAGMEIGNHTWDHPCLDRCTPEGQESQIDLAHEWLSQELGVPVHFAYPNGDRTEHAARHLLRKGYAAPLLFDHRIARRPSGEGALSRLRLDADAPVGRASAVLSGAHADVFDAQQRTWIKARALAGIVARRAPAGR